MWKKRVCGLTLLVAGLLVWSCGDGSVDALGDKELLMISRFDPVDMRDSIVLVCYKNGECWKKFEKTGEIFLGDFYFKIPDTTLLRLVTGGDSLVVEGDSAFVWKDGKKLPVFNFSSNSNDDDDDDVTSNGSTATSGSSSKRSSASGFEKDEGSEFGDDPNSSGSGTSSRAHAEDGSSSSQKKSSSSTGGSQYTNSSSSQKVASANSADIDLGSSSSKINIVPSSVSRSSSSQTVVQASSSSIASHSGGGGGGESGTMCATNTTLSGSCTGSPNPQVKNKTVTYTFKPDKNNTCSAPDNVEWFVNSPSDGADQTYKKYSYNSAQTQYTHNIKYSTAGNKKSVVFSMGGKNVVCDAVTIKADCNTNNSYSCTLKLNSASNNLTKNNPVSYTWTLTKGGCYDVTSITWSGSVSASGSDVYTVTKEFSSAGTYSESISVVDESSTTPKSVACSTATVRNVTETKPSFNVADITVAVAEASLTVTPTNVVGCDYDSDQCSYILKKTSGSPSVSGNHYSNDSGALKPISGESAGKVNYTLILTNYKGSTTNTFDVTYVTPIDTSLASEGFAVYEPGSVYRISVGNSVYNGFGCKITSHQNNNTYSAGTFNGTLLTFNGWQTATGKVTPAANSTDNIFVVAQDAPAGMTCGISW